MHCLAKGCNHNESHTSDGHQCGICGKFGHGAFEHGDKEKIYLLQYHTCKNMPPFPEHLHCTIKSCTRKSNHSTESHVCSICKGRGHSRLIHRRKVLDDE
jgi:hypothetical protein